jgi:inner membrane protein
MSPVTHFLTGWLISNIPDNLNRRDRAIITLSGVAPDLDSLGIVAELLTRGSEHPLLWWSEYHHVAGHNLGFSLFVVFIAFFLAVRRWETTGLALLSFHLHLLEDLAGARGPDGYQWPFSYLLPFSDGWEWAWGGQWELNAWPNFVVTGAALALTFYLAWRRGYSPIEMFSRSSDKAFVEVLRRRFPRSEVT